MGSGGGTVSGWVENTKAGTYKGVYRDDSGRRHSKTFTDRKAAHTFAMSGVVDLSRGHWVDPRSGEVLFQDWAERWAAVRFVRPTTRAGNDSVLRRHLIPHFGWMQLKAITPMVVRGFLAELSSRISEKTVRNVYSLLATILKDAILEGLIVSNPCVGVRLPKGRPHEAVFLSPAQIDQLVACIRPHYQPLVLTAAGTGMRWGELAGLTRRNVDLIRRQLYVKQTLLEVNGTLSFGEPKTTLSRRVISLPPSLVMTLGTHLADHRHELVFTTENGDAMRRNNFLRRIWRPAVAEAGLDPAPRFHDLRHSHVAILISAGVPMKAIQARLGHSTIVMTMDRYGHLLPDVDEKLINALEQQLTGT